MGPSFSHRLSAFEAAERTWRADDDALRLILEDGSAVAWPWSGLNEVRLTYAATALKPWRRKVWFRFDQGGTVSFDNGHFVSVGVFEDRSPAFRAIVAAAVERGEAAGRVRYVLGTPPAMYWAQTLGAGLALMLLAFVVWTIPVSEWPEPVWAKFAVVFGLAPAAAVWMVLSRPRRTSKDGLLEALDR